MAQTHAKELTDPLNDDAHTLANNDAHTLAKDEAHTLANGEAHTPLRMMKHTHSQMARNIHLQNAKDSPGDASILSLKHKCLSCRYNPDHYEEQQLHIL